MEPISFEKVTPEEAKAVLDARDKTDKPKNVGQEKRSPISHDELQLHESTFRWLASLPIDVQPRQLARAYPRIANNLALMWDEKSLCEKMLDALMIDDRGNRQGFPFAVAKEILALKMHINPEYLNNLPD